jgi:hypothetical protein
MRKLGVKVVVFGIGFIVLLKIMGRFDNIDKQTSTNPNIIRTANAHRFDSLDILFIGSSAAYSGINPAYFDSVGLRTYNLSIAAAGPYFYELLINDYTGAVKQKPKAVFILVMPNTFSEKVDDFYEIGIHRYLEKSVSNEKIVQVYPGWETYPYLLLKSFQKGIKNLFFMQKASPSTIQQEINDKGFYRSDEQTSVEKEKKEIVLYADWKLQKFQEHKLVHLKQLARTIGSKGIKVVFFTLPGNKVNTFFNPSFMIDYRRAELSLKKEWKFIDVSSVKMDSSAYRNIDHINTKGASIVSTKMASEIMNDEELRELLKTSHDNKPGIR